MGALYTCWKKYILQQDWAEGLEMPWFPVIKKYEDGKKMQAVEANVQTQILGNLSNATCNSCRPDQRGKPVGHTDVYEFCMLTGIRECEVCLLKVKNMYPDEGDFWMDEHLVKVNPDLAKREGNLARLKGSWVPWPGLKSSSKKKKEEDRGGRWVALTPRAAEIAHKHMQGKHPESYLFINPLTNDRYTPDTIYRAHRNHAGVENVTFHETTRHTFVTDVMDRGTSVEDAMVLTGHSDERSLKGYHHMRRKRVRDVAKKALADNIVYTEFRRTPVK
jgi:integrase